MSRFDCFVFVFAAAVAAAAFGCLQLGTVGEVCGVAMDVVVQVWAAAGVGAAGIAAGAPALGVWGVVMLAALGVIVFADKVS